MARPEKKGLDYFPFDVDADSDDKFLLIISRFGNKGFGVIIRLMMKIYREGYFYAWTEKERILFSGRIGESIEYIDEVVDECLRWSIFNKTLYKEYKILTSVGIQKRYIEATVRRKNVKMLQQFLLIEVNDNIIKVNDNINPIDSNISTQSKVKESKVKESKVNSGVTSLEDDVPTVSDSETWNTSISIANYLLESICQWDATHKYHKNPPSLKGWVTEIDRAIRLDGRTEEQLKFIIEFVFYQNNAISNFWGGNIQSGEKLRLQFDKIKNQIKSEQQKQKTSNTNPNGNYKTKGDRAVEFFNRP